MTPSIDNGCEALARAVKVASQDARPQRIIPDCDVVDLVAYARACEQGTQILLEPFHWGASPEGITFYLGKHEIGQIPVSKVPDLILDAAKILNKG